MPLKHSVSEVELKNGAKGLIVDVPDSSVFYYDIGFRAGNSYVKKPEIHQTAHLLEHLAFNGTKKHPSPEEFSQIFTENGAYNNANTQEVNISYYGGSADFEAERILDLQGQALSEPIFSEEALAKEKRTVGEELTGQLSNYYRYLWLRMIKPLGVNSLTDEEKIAVIDNTTLEDIWEHHTRTHTTSNMRFVLGGNIRGKRLQKILNSIEDWNLPKGEPFDIKQRKLKKHQSPTMIEKDQVQNVFFNLAMFVNRRVSAREMYALSALTHTLTGTFHSRIFGKARKLGLSYHIDSAGGRYDEGTSEIQFITQVSPDNAQPLYELIIEELNSISKNGITTEELDSFKRFYYGQYQLSGQTVGSITGYYGGSFARGDKRIDLEDTQDIIKSITVGEVKSLINEFLESGIWSFGELGAVSKKTNQKAYDTFAKKLFDRSKV